MWASACIRTFLSSIFNLGAAEIGITNFYSYPAHIEPAIFLFELTSFINSGDVRKQLNALDIPIYFTTA